MTSKLKSKRGASDEEMAKWLDSHGEKKTPEEVKAWSDGMDAVNPYNDPEKREWFEEQTKPHGLDASKTTLFHWLDVDDKASHATASASA